MKYWVVWVNDGDAKIKKFKTKKERDSFIWRIDSLPEEQCKWVFFFGHGTVHEYDY